MGLELCGPSWSRHNRGSIFRQVVGAPLIDNPGYGCPTSGARGVSGKMIMLQLFVDNLAWICYEQPKLASFHRTLFDHQFTALWCAPAYQHRKLATIIMNLYIANMMFYHSNLCTERSRDHLDQRFTEPVGQPSRSRWNDDRFRWLGKLRHHHLLVRRANQPCWRSPPNLRCRRDRSITFGTASLHLARPDTETLLSGSGCGGGIGDP
jgi:hypothetical protein